MERFSPLDLNSCEVDTLSKHQASSAYGCPHAIDHLMLLSGFRGQASIIDGDTLEIDGKRIRLWGIDAPENSQLCRDEDSLQYLCGANELDSFIARRGVTCSPININRYGRTVASCSVAGVDLSVLVRRGLAFDWPLYSKGK
jgi:endonuclease YncB( thermonuclease family)